MSNSNICTIIGSDKGGVGKSLIAQIMLIAFDQGKVPLKVIEIDHQRKLTSIFKDRIDLAMDAGVDIAKADGGNRLVETFFDGAYELWATGNSLTDLGANVTTPLLNWIQHCDVQSLATQDRIDFRFVAVATPDDQAIRSAITSLEHARRALGLEASLFLILNNVSGAAGFDPYRGTDLWQRIAQLQNSHGVHIVELPYCSSTVMEYGRAWSKTVIEILDERSGVLDHISAAANFSRVERHHQIKRFTDWVRAVQVAMSPLFNLQPAQYRQAAE